MTVGSAAWRHRMYQRTYYRMPGWLGRWRERRHARYGHRRIWRHRRAQA